MESGSNRSRNILIGVVVIIIIILSAIFLIRRAQSSNQNSLNLPTFTPISQFQQQLQTNFGIKVPASAVKADLVDINRGNQMGLVTLDKSNGQNVYTVIANLNDPSSGYFYQAWLINDSTKTADIISLGKLNLAKGGWLVNYSSIKDLSDHKKVWVTLEKIADNTPEKHILEGSF